ncbi:restriction endonuclease subunit S [Eubacterium sp. 1001713B170207_170306_E7]|uniref:restriction endonuclease subunit S n=1 Tax=Eubacterium sp. 1001713B170207_170306_E7 TaxID=2787097 RepID=UPI00189A03A2|nr:restriction endonuclease subunit S [Eubacterium sp. 1001713B170207_170306_E7]
MNYLTELLAFYRWLAGSPVSPLLQAYWHLLMYTNNRAAIQTAEGVWYWPAEFNLPNTVAMPLLGIKDRRVLLRQRGYLINRGRVTYQKDAGQRAGVYRMVPFDKSLEAIWLRDKREDRVTQVWAPAVPPAVGELSPLININTKQASPLYGYQENAASVHGFNLLPPLTDEEKAEIKARYPEDDVAAFNAMWAARERKQMAGKG